MGMSPGLPPAWSIRRPKPVFQNVYDLLGAPLRMVLIPDHISERVRLTSLRAERMAAVLPELRGRVLDIGAGDNGLLKLYRQRAEGSPGHDDAAASVGLDVVDWGGDCVIVENCRQLPFNDASFDTVSYVACLNHIPEREEALAETLRILRPGGRIVVTMIGKLVGDVGHALWWYSEDKHREVQDGEVMGMDPVGVSAMIGAAGFVHLKQRRFVYALNHLFLAEKPDDLPHTDGA